jgi:lysophospholipase L1-like esterase
MDDPYPGGQQHRGWADLVANRLAEVAPGFRYANLAIRGRLLGPVIAEQVPVALELRPELISFAAGGNDALRPGFDGARLGAILDEVVSGIRGCGADLLLFQFAPLNARLPGRRLFQTRAAVLNRVVGEVADRHGALLVDLSIDGEFTNPVFWSVDRLHLNEYGHRRVAAHVLTVLGVHPDPDWWEPPAALRVASWTGQRVADLRWAGTYLAPWVHRRLTGRSSGDNRVPKRPTLDRLG